MDVCKIRRALISVSDKQNVESIGAFLSQWGVEILSTGGTARILSEKDIPVTSVDSYTGHPEIMDGRVKTLHPKIHGGILAVRDEPHHMEDMKAQGIAPIDLVIVNLYPFEKTVAQPDVSCADAIENIDIGGPTMVRSSAKNHAWVTVVVDPHDYNMLMREIETHGGVRFQTRRKLAVKAFEHTAGYDHAITQYLKQLTD
ncbi:MAG: IMP cyclohydrolase [Fibrobacterota bacterium]